MTRKIGWIALTLLATAVSLYAAAVLFVPGFGPPFLAERRSVMPWALGGHIAGGLVALAAAPWQLLGRLRQARPAVHRWIGRVYVGAVLVGGLGGLALATVSMEGLVTHLGFGTLAVLWLASTTLALAKARASDFDAHRRWMIRSLALTFAAVTLRLFLPAAALAGIPFAEAYRAVAWVCWVPNLLVVEWWILPRLAPRIAMVRPAAKSALAPRPVVPAVRARG